MTRRCPLCRGEAVKEGNKFWPLCSERCSMIDLGKWLAEDYRVPAEPADGEGQGDDVGKIGEDPRE